jgi:tetratricopeptide (TPR) repeat protein
MADTPSALRTTNPDALREYQVGVEQKTKGTVDAALTSFRRAVIADPNFVEAQFQIGLICKDKGRRDPMFKRYAFDAFRAAARLDAGNQQAHDQYILAAQESGRIEELHAEYDALAKQNPQSDLFQRCYKNILTLEMAMIPQRVDVGGAKASGTMRRFTLAVSFGAILVGLALVFLPALFGKKGQVEKKHWNGLMKAGMGLAVFGFGGVLLSTRLK